MQHKFFIFLFWKCRIIFDWTTFYSVKCFWPATSLPVHLFLDPNFPENGTFFKPQLGQNNQIEWKWAETKSEKFKITLQDTGKSSFGKLCNVTRVTDTPTLTPHHLVVSPLHFCVCVCQTHDGWDCPHPPAESTKQTSTSSAAGGHVSGVSTREWGGRKVKERDKIQSAFDPKPSTVSDIFLFAQNQVLETTRDVDPWSCQYIWCHFPPQSNYGWCRKAMQDLFTQLDRFLHLTLRVLLARTVGEFPWRLARVDGQNQ